LYINEFFVKRDDTSGVMIDDLVDRVCDYYNFHACKTLHYYRDRHGDSRKPNVKNSATYNQQAITRFEKRDGRSYQKCIKVRNLRNMTNIFFG
jgi:phytoene dehydrogenase-like protein